jgi:hypothetical protein
LEWSLIPEGIRRAIHELIPPHLDQQRCIDMLAARLARDATWPEDKRVGAPVKWFKGAVADPDFAAADTFAAERLAPHLAA